MADRARCPDCGRATVVVLDDITAWSRVIVVRGQLQRGALDRAERPLRVLGGHIREDDDLLCTYGPCGWMGRRDSVASS